MSNQALAPGEPGFLTQAQRRHEIAQWITALVAQGCTRDEAVQAIAAVLADRRRDRALPPNRFPYGMD